WAGKGPATKPQIIRSATDRSALTRLSEHDRQSNRDLQQWLRLGAIRCLSQKLGKSSARCPHRLRDTP
ncbi:hypothetical protein, partial [Xanthomonas arboricola]|uniref:hypothetical protein n=1 Tax=Xanthomonas arboricola TaxID=56448 RepID=UPI001C61433B